VSVVTGHLNFLLQGLTVTLELTGLSFVFAFFIGLVAATARVSPVRSLRAVGTVYVELFQNVPLLAWLVVFVFALPQAGFILPLFQTAVLVLSLYEGAYVCEVVRSGINTVALGQGEAARAIGLSTGQALRHVILPQAVRSVIQPLGNVFIATTMASSLTAAVGIVELTSAANSLDLKYAQPIPIFVGAGIVYMAVNLIVGQVTGLLERRLVVQR
jgi:glutamate transport system permease protein